MILSYLRALLTVHSLSPSLDMTITVTNDIPYGELAAQKLDLYVPAPSSSDRERSPIVCFVHGGAWRAYALLTVRLPFPS